MNSTEIKAEEENPKKYITSVKGNQFSIPEDILKDLEIEDGDLIEVSLVKVYQK